MPTGKVKWYDADKGFGFVTNPGAEDAHIAASALPKGITEIYPGQRIEYEVVTGGRGPQVLRVIELSETPKKFQHKFTPEQLQSMIQDTMSMLENNVQPVLAQSRWPERKEARQVAEILRTVARELEH